MNYEFDDKESKEKKVVRIAIMIVVWINRFGGDWTGLFV